MKHAYKILLSLITLLILYSQGYSLVSGVYSASTLTPERMEDTDPEDIVTLDPVLLTRNKALEGLKNIQTDLVPLFLSLLCAVLAPILLLMTESLKATLSEIERGLLRMVLPRKKHRWLQNRAILS